MTLWEVLRGQRSEADREAILAANGVDLAARRLARTMGVAGAVVLALLLAAIGLR